MHTYFRISQAGQAVRVFLTSSSALPFIPYFDGFLLFSLRLFCSKSRSTPLSLFDVLFQFLPGDGLGFLLFHSSR